MYDQVILDLYHQLQVCPPKADQDRLERISAFFLESPYCLGALGEGPKGRFDQSPLYRTDVFDCLTYVSTVLALHRADNLAAFQREIAAINYRHGQIRYENRHHFMSIDWNVANCERGLLQDVTTKIVASNNQSVAVVTNTFIDRPNWFLHRQMNDIKWATPLTDQQRQCRLMELRALGQTISGAQSQLAYIPLDQLFDSNAKPCMDLLNQIPDGCVLEMVRPSWDLREQIGTCLDVSHLGFVFKKNDDLMFRHASLLEKKVTEISLIDYLANYLNHQSIKGIHLLRVLNEHVAV